MDQTAGFAAGLWIVRQPPGTHRNLKGHACTQTSATSAGALSLLPL